MSETQAALGLPTARAVAAAPPLATQGQAAMTYGGHASPTPSIRRRRQRRQFFWSGNNWRRDPIGWRAPGAGATAIGTMAAAEAAPMAGTPDPSLRVAAPGVAVALAP
jgi:hypothetical protein